MTVTARAVHLADQALAVLRDSTHPLTTAEISQRLGLPPRGALPTLRWLETQQHPEIKRGAQTLPLTMMFMADVTPIELENPHDY